MNNKFILYIGLSISLALSPSCEKPGVLCGGNDPGKDLPWLKQEISRLSSLTGCNSISRSSYKEQTVFIFSNCDPNINSVPLLFDCDGKPLNLSVADYQELKFTGSIELIWKSQ